VCDSAGFRHLARSPHVVPDRPVRLPDLSLFQQVIIEKLVFDVCSNPNAAPILRQLDEGLRAVVYGVATDICVASASQATARSGLSRRVCS